MPAVYAANDAQRFARRTGSTAGDTKKASKGRQFGLQRGLKGRIFWRIPADVAQLGPQCAAHH